MGKKYGLKYRNTGGAAKRWTEPRVRETLARLCVGRDIPSADDFAAAGGGLYGAIARRHGGHDRWAAKVALPDIAGATVAAVAIAQPMNL